jgi:hypothetical protein
MGDKYREHYNRISNLIVNWTPMMEGKPVEEIPVTVKIIISEIANLYALFEKITNETPKP